MKLYLNILILSLCLSAGFVHADPTQSPPSSEQWDEDGGASAMAKNNVQNASAEAVGELLGQAMSLLGVAYRFGGNSPSTGLDCSAFVQYVFKKSLGVNLPRTAAQQASMGREVSKDELKAGDLVFFNTRGFRYSHVGLYVGNNKFIHSPRAGKSVEVTSLGISYWTKRWNGARRVSRTGNEKPVKPAETKVAASTTKKSNQVTENQTVQSDDLMALIAGGTAVAAATSKKVKPAQEASNSENSSTKKKKPQAANDTSVKNASTMSTKNSSRTKKSSSTEKNAVSTKTSTKSKESSKSQTSKTKKASSSTPIPPKTTKKAATQKKKVNG